jgi:hypothetical protein
MQRIDAAAPIAGQLGPSALTMVQKMDLDEPLPRLLRLRASLSEALPQGEIRDADAAGLAESYVRLRAATRALATDLGAGGDEFDAQFPEVAGNPMRAPARMHEVARHGFHNREVASTSATLLRQLAGYVAGLVEAVVLDQNFTMEQIAAAREAARQPPGFHAPS